MDSNEPNDKDVDCKAWNLQAVNDAHSMVKHDYSEANTCWMEYVDSETLAVKNKVFEKIDSQWSAMLVEKTNYVMKYVIEIMAIWTSSCMELKAGSFSSQCSA